jgi:radical SAM superfamily enzyme YgiQ (UPF0313 family)
VKIALYMPDAAFKGKLTSGPQSYYRPPHAYLTLMASLEQAGHQGIIVDGRLDDPMPDDFDYIGVGVTTGIEILDALRFCAEYPDVTKIWGGWHPTMTPEQTAEHPLVDIVVRGQGERTLVDIMNGEAHFNIPGLTYQTKRKRMTISTPDRPIIPISELPRPAWHAVDMNRYMRTWGDQKIFYYLSSQGCPWRCSFCEVSIVKPKRSALDPALVKKELSALKDQYGFNTVVFEDSNFFIHTKWGRAMAENMKELDLLWQIKCRSDQICTVSDAQLSRYKECGLDKIALGVEAWNDRDLKIMNKKETVGKHETAIAALERADLRMGYGVMMGLPGQLDEDADVTLDFMERTLREHPERSVSVFCYMPYPGTALHERAVKYGFRDPDTLEGWATKIGHDPGFGGGISGISHGIPISQHILGRIDRFNELRQETEKKFSKEHGRTVR